jgi:retinol-binding protein 3
MFSLHKIALCTGLFFSLSLHAQTAPPAKDMAIDAATKNTVIKTLNEEMRKKYVFLEVAKKVEAMLLKRQKNGDYDKITSAETFANTLTEHVQSATNDKHLRINYAQDEIPLENPNAAQNQEKKEKDAAEDLGFMKFVNFGVERVERLPGNVGYLELRGFGNTEIVGHAISAAMVLLNASDALIIDLRKNGGGEPATVALLASYFTPAQTHLSDIYNRSEEKTQQFWSAAYTAAPRYNKNKKVYVLTSKDTFSAAEDLTYTLQSLKRITTIGEVSGGGAHPVDDARLHAHFNAAIPYGRSINPITKTNWEGVGVIPEIKVDAAKALKTAHELALTALLETEKHPGKRGNIADALKTLQAVN